MSYRGYKLIGNILRASRRNVAGDRESFKEEIAGSGRDGPVKSVNKLSASPLGAAEGNDDAEEKIQISRAQNTTRFSTIWCGDGKENLLKFFARSRKLE